MQNNSERLTSNLFSLSLDPTGTCRMSGWR